jgi:MFS family permease
MPLEPFCFGILFGSIRAINPSAAQSILAELVPREDLLNAVSLYTVGFNFARIMGPSLGGILVLWIGIGGCYAALAAHCLGSRNDAYSVKRPKSCQLGTELSA